MANEAVSPLGAQFGPNFLIVTTNDETGTSFSLNIYPDTNNPLLKANNLPMHFYFMPQRVYLAKVQSSPLDYDFGMTIFKGLMTTEDTIGVSDANTSGGELDTGGGICSFSTTFAIPDSVIQNAINILKKKAYGTVGKSVDLSYFNIEPTDPDPELGIVPILENNVTIEVPAVQGVGDSKSPYFINAQGSGKGSIEAKGISSFLVTCNQLAAGAIAGSIQGGVSPFTVHYNLKQQFYINACDIHIIIDVDKVFTQFSGAVSAGGFGGISDFDLSVNYQNCLTSGAISTIIKMDGASVPDDMKKMIEQQVDQMQQRAFDLVKTEIFDWKPTPDAPATAQRSLFSSIFGGASVSLKANYQKKGIKLEQDFRIDTTVGVYDTVSGALKEIEPAIKANKDKYLAIVDVGEYFKKIQVAATTNANWNEKLADGTDLSDPIQSIQVQAGYPDYSSPLDASNKANPQYKAQGFHYTVGHKDSSQGASLAQWTADNPKDIINLSFLRLDKTLPDWNVDQVKLKKTIVFNADDPRVELSNNGSTFTTEILTKDHAPVLTPSEVGYIFVRFMLDRMLPKENVMLTLQCKIGNRTDTLTITKQNQKNAIWEIFSDKYFDQTSFQYKLSVEVAGPSFTDAPVNYETDWITTSLPTGRVKYLNPLKIAMPAPPADKVDTINSYIKNYQPS